MVNLSIGNVFAGLTVQQQNLKDPTEKPIVNFVLLKLLVKFL